MSIYSYIVHFTCHRRRIAGQINNTKLKSGFMESIEKYVDLYQLFICPESGYVIHLFTLELTYTL